MELANGTKAYHAVVSTGFHENLNRLKNCDEICGIKDSLKILGFRDERVLKTGYKHGYKLVFIKEFLESIAEEPDAFVFFTDAHDVLVTAPMQTVYDLFSSEFKNADIVFGTERYAYPDWKIEKLWPESALATSHPFLNSGGYCGRAGVLLDYLNRYPFTWESDDQAYWQHVYISEFLTNKFQLDHKNHIFACMFDFCFDWKQLNWSDEHERWSLTQQPLPGAWQEKFGQLVVLMHQQIYKKPKTSPGTYDFAVQGSEKNKISSGTEVEKEMDTWYGYLADKHNGTAWVTWPVVLHFNACLKPVLGAYYHVLDRNRLSSDKCTTRHQLNEFYTRDLFPLVLIAATALCILMVCFYCLFRMVRFVLKTTRRVAQKSIARHKTRRRLMHV